MSGCVCVLCQRVRETPAPAQVSARHVLVIAVAGFALTFLAAMSTSTPGL